MPRRSARSLAPCLLFALALVMTPGSARAANAPAAEDPYEAGVRLLDQGQWSDALPIYRRITRENPTYAWGWMGLGWSLHYTGDYADALPAYERALSLGALPPARILLEMARCEIALGRRDQALATLDRALAAGLTRVGALGRDERLRPLWAEPRFRAMIGAIDSARVSRTEGWRSDLVLLGREVRRLRVTPFARCPEAEFDRELAAISRDVPRLDDEALDVRVMRLVCRLGDGHTEATAPFQSETRERAVPLIFSLFDDGLFVTAADSANVDLLWAAVTSVNGVPADTALARLDVVCARDNPMRARSVAPRRLRFPQILHALGVGGSATRLELGVVDRHGTPGHRSVAIAARPVADWVRRPPDVTTELPSFVRRRFDLYWFDYVPERRLVVFQYNGCADKDSESVEQFASRLRDFLDTHDVDRLVVDLRWNGGGNNFLNGPLLEAIVQSRRVNRPGHLFVIAGRHTFSAAMCFAAQLERFTHAWFVGEPTGSSPNFIGETNPVRLPYSGVVVSLSNLYWQNSEATDARVWIPPRLPVPWMFASWRAGRDDALDAIERLTP